MHQTSRLVWSMVKSGPVFCSCSTDWISQALVSTNNKLICTCYFAATPLVIFQKLSKNFGFTLGWDPVMCFRCFVSSCWDLVFVYWSIVSFLFLYFTYRIYSSFSRHKCGAYSREALIGGRCLFRHLLFLYSYSTAHFLSVNFSMDWY